MYYSCEEYKARYPDRASRYEIVSNMRRYQESKWHRDWKIPTEIYSKSEFVSAVKADALGNVGDDNNSRDIEPMALKDIWDNSFSCMVVKNVKTNDEIIITCNQKGEMFREFKTNCIKYKYVDNKYGYKSLEEKQEYPLSHKDENSKIWVLIKSKIKGC